MVGELGKAGTKASRSRASGVVKMNKVSAATRMAGIEYLVILIIDMFLGDR